MLAWLEAAAAAAARGPASTSPAAAGATRSRSPAAACACSRSIATRPLSPRSQPRPARARCRSRACAPTSRRRRLPLAPGRGGALVVCRYLWRPLVPALAGALAPGGWLLYETFTGSPEKLGYGPRNPAFLLAPGELPRLFPGLAVEAFEERVVEGARGPEALARLAARRPL